MNEIYKLNTYVHEGQSVYGDLEEVGVSSHELKSDNKSSNSKISEDEYTEIDISEDENMLISTNEKTAKDMKIQILENQYKIQQQEYFSKQLEITKLTNLKAQAEFEVVAYPKDSEERKSAQGIVDKIQGKIDGINSRIDSFINNMSKIRKDIEKLKEATTQE